MSELVAGKTFPWDHVAGYYLRLQSFLPFSTLTGEKVGPPKLGAFGLALAELPNPDVDSEQRVVTLPVENKSDFKSLHRAYNHPTVKAGLNELVILFENRKGMLGRRKPSFHVAAYPVGTWQTFYDAVAASTLETFRWPKPAALYQPSDIAPFPDAVNLFLQ